MFLDIFISIHSIVHSTVPVHFPIQRLLRHTSAYATTRHVISSLIPRLFIGKQIAWQLPCSSCIWIPAWPEIVLMIVPSDKNETFLYLCKQLLCCWSYSSIKVHGSEHFELFETMHFPFFKYGLGRLQSKISLFLLHASFIPRLWNRWMFLIAGL